MSSSSFSAESLSALKDRFLHHLEVRNFSRATVAMRRGYLNRFLLWCEQRGATRLEELTREVLLGYQRHLFYLVSERTGRRLKFSTQVSLLTPVRAWLSYLVREGLLGANPALDIDLPKEEQRLPTALSAAQAEQILAQPDITRPLGLRDRAILETLYSTAIRRGELIALSLFDIDGERGVVLVRQGKGRKDRVAPISRRALEWIEKYAADVRPQLAERTGSGALFLSRSGRPLTGACLSLAIRNYILRAGVTAPGSCHLFRHAAATQMLERGADIRALQSLLGHAKVTTTQLYTHVSITRLKEVHQRTHPGAQPPASAAAEDDGPAS